MEYLTVNFDLDRSGTVSAPTTGTHDRITFVDFSPQVNSSYVKALFTKPETYGELINRANDWLEEHAEWQAKTVESALFDPTRSLNKSVAHASNVEQHRKLFSVRLWLCPREDSLQPIQRLKVLNLIPKLIITGRNHELIEPRPVNRLNYSSLEVPTFETVEEIVPHLNSLLQANKYFGQILNIETVALPIRANKFTVDTENLEFPAANCKGILNILRVHFNERLFMNETVEILNFVPEVETWNAPLAVPNLESFTGVLKKASLSLRQRTDSFRFLSCSTIACPTNGALSSQVDGSFIDPNKTFYSISEWHNSGAFSAKYVRIAIARPMDQEKSSLGTTLLNCKIFVPVKKSQAELSNGDHEMQTLKEAIQKWFAKTEAKVLSVETEIISSAITWTSSTTLIDTCLSLNKFPCDILVIFKVYIDGHYIEPSRNKKQVQNE